MIKKLCYLLFSLSLIFNSLTVNAAFDREYSWYVKRNGSLRPQIQPEQTIIYDYDGYFLDKNLSDGSSTKRIYLTFDLGYENGNTEKILNVLKEYNIKAAFFILDNIILKNTDLVTRMSEDGHLICNHTKNHKNLSRSSEKEIRENITVLEELLQERTGIVMAKYFRFPEGRYSESALKAVKSLGYKSIFWSFAYEDWDNAHQPDLEKAYQKIISNTHNGAVMLFHPTSATNAAIFSRLVDSWKAMGYNFGTLDELTK